MSSRTFFLDRLRVGLTALVVTHHSAITYGGSGGWFYREVTDGSRWSSLLLTMLCAVDQAFFMGLFFLLAGYFTPASLARKGGPRFLLDRAVRLGLPLVLFGFVLGPMTVALAGTAKGQPFLEHWAGLLASGRFIAGPLWFVQALLLFAVGHALLAQFCRPPHTGPDDRSLPGPAAWLLSALGVGAAALLLRQWVPVGQERFGLQIGYFASYVFLYVLGAAAWRHRWLERVERRQSRPWAWAALATAPLLPLVTLVTEALTGRAANVATGWSLPAVVYALWEPVVAWGVIAVLLRRGRAQWNQPSPTWQRWSARAYGAFIVHAPVIVALALLLQPWGAPPLLKFALVATAGTAVSFGLAGLLLRLPGARRVL
jgi:hypothetical protein